MYGQFNIIWIFAVQMFQYSECSFITTYIHYTKFGWEGLANVICINWHWPRLIKCYVSWEKNAPIPKPLCKPLFCMWSLGTATGSPQVCHGWQSSLPDPLCRRGQGLYHAGCLHCMHPRIIEIYSHTRIYSSMGLSGFNWVQRHNLPLHHCL